LKRVASIELLAEYIGAAAAVALVREFGGLSIKVPKRPAGRVWARLVDAMGEQGASDLVDSFGGEGLYIARNAVEELEQRRQQIAALAAKGKSYAQIARMYTYAARYTERGIRRILASTPGDVHTPRRTGHHPNQMGLLHADGSPALPAPDTLEGVWGRVATVHQRADSVPAET